MPLPSPKPFSIGSGQRVRRPTDARGLAWITPYQCPSCSAAPARAPLAKPRLSSRGSAQAGEIVGEIGDLLHRDRLQHLGHGAVIAVAAVVLVFGERLGEIILALVGDARDVVAP